MFVHPQIDPVAFHIGSFEIHWYGIMYLIGFLAFLGLGRWQMRKRPWHHWTPRMLDDVLFYGIFGVIFGGRIGYVLFYQFNYFIKHPFEILAIWQGGMSFHGGFLGVLIAMWVFARKYHLKWLVIMDFVTPLVPIGLGAGRLGNFINGELWGRVTNVPWGMVFPKADSLLRHPSQLYEFCLEGVLLFLLLWIYSSKPRTTGSISALFLITYGSFRFLVEFTREPDDFLGLLSMGLSMGQWLSLPMIFIGIGLMAKVNQKKVEGFLIQ